MEYTNNEVQSIVNKTQCSESHAKQYLLAKKGIDSQTIASRFGYSVNTSQAFIEVVSDKLKGKSSCILDKFSNDFGCRYS